MVVGAGGLGAPVLSYLVATGIGKIGIADGDEVSLSNLQRQVLFTTDQLGENKAFAAKNSLSRLNPHIEIEVYSYHLTSENIESIIKGYDVIVDGTDNLPAKYLLNDASVLFNKPLVYGSIYRFEGQVSVFNYLLEGERGPNYRDLYPTPPPPELVPSCAEGGVLGVLPGFIGSLQASEVIKVLLESKDTLTGKLFLADLQHLDFRIVSFKRKESNSIEKLIDYEYFCNINASKEMKSVTVHDLKRMMDSGEDFQLIDVREFWEHEFANIGGELIPQSQVMAEVSKIDTEKKVIVYCRSGKRSANAIQVLEDQHSMVNLYNLEGGILAWSSEIDPSIPPY